MQSQLTSADYKKILEYYNQTIPKSKRLLKSAGEKFLADKLCSCIKSVSPFGNESRAIGVCTKTVLNKRNIKRGNFTCKEKRRIKGLKKTKKNVAFSSKTK